MLTRGYFAAHHLAIHASLQFDRLLIGLLAANIVETAMADEALPLVLVPGLLCTADLFAHQIAALRADRPVSVADPASADSMAAIARAALAAAPPRFALAGLSMGGYIAFEMLRQAPGRIARLALLDTNARADRPEQSEQRRQLVDLGRRDGVAAVQRALLPVLIHPSRMGETALVARIVRMAEDMGLAAFERQQTAIIGRPDNRGFLKDIVCPTLIIVGEADQITPLKVHEEMQAGIPGSRLEVVRDSGHLPTMEKPEATTALLRSWLAC
jgi:pimeloyl-ACP methyl ester carboxylesterase